MRKLLAVLMLLASSVSAAPYFDTIYSNPTHPKMSVTAMYTSALVFDGMATDVAAVFHKADPSDSLWPQKLLDLGFPPVSWSLLDVGFGGNAQSGFVKFGSSVDVAQTLLGPVTTLLKGAGGKAASFGALLISPDGGGVKAGIAWKGNVVTNAGLTRFNQIRFPARYTIGYCYQF